MTHPDLTARLAGITSPNPFWLASGPPTNSAYQVLRAFEAGWGGAVWKTIAHDPIVNVYSRYGGIDYDGRKLVGFNNIELITDRSLDTNLEEIAEVKREFPDRPVVVSLMVETRRETWHDIVHRVEDTGCDGLELNFGCPHGMSERGMGSAVGQVPEYTRMVTEWVKEVARTPVLVKLTPNVADVRYPGRAAAEGGADAISLINTINSIMGVDLETLNPKPQVDGRGSHGGYCGPAVKPIALNMVQQIASDPDIRIPVSGIGGVQTWQDAVEFLLLGAANVQVCTAVMHYGFRIVEQLETGLRNWMRERGFTNLPDFVGRTADLIGDWADLNLGYRITAEIDQSLCIHCGLCYIACEDGAHQSIRVSRRPESEYLDAMKPASPPTAEGPGDRTFETPATGRVLTSGGREILAGAGDGYVNIFEIDGETCVGCNLCSLVCPVTDCISMIPQASEIPDMTWREYQERLAAGDMQPIHPPAHR